jgi:NAD+ synthase
MNTEKLVHDVIKWIKEWFDENGKDCNAVIGISGGKDSTIVAALCVAALGKDRVIGVMMPNGEQKDISDSQRVCNLLGIKSYTVNIGPAVEAVKNSIGFKLSEQSETNLPARIRMSTLYAISQSNNGRVANTCNRSEDYVGYSSKYGDAAGDFSPLANLTVKEVLCIGDFLILPYDLVHKTPIDGLKTNPDGSYVTDEQSLGFTYSELDDYLLMGKLPTDEKLGKIERMHRRAVAKNKMLVFEKQE